MVRDFKGAMSPETEKLAGKKFKFSNPILEVVDDPIIRIVDNSLLDPLMKKLPEDVQDVLVVALAEVIEEMPEITIG